MASKPFILLLYEEEFIFIYLSYAELFFLRSLLIVIFMTGVKERGKLTRSEYIDILLGRGSKFVSIRFMTSRATVRLYY